MKTIGLIGGMSWESTAHYYRIINQQVRARLGGLHSAQIVLVSVDFAAIAKLQHDDDWVGLSAALVASARSVEAAGADMLLIATNTMHKLADDVAAAINIPLLHIVDTTSAAICAAGLSKVGLLGTAFTMEQDFYKGRMNEHFGLDVVVPDAADRKLVHSIIYDELVQGRVEGASRDTLRTIIARLVAQGAQAIVLGCTELMLIIHVEDSAVPLFDTTAIHATAAVERALAGPLTIQPYSDALAPAFHDINAQWINTMFAMEETDRDVLQNPRARIIDRGGGHFVCRG